MDTKPAMSDLPSPSTSSQPLPAGPSNVALIKREDVERADNLIVNESLRRKRKWNALGYGPEEIDIKEKTVTSYQLALLQDQQSTLYPAPPTSFTSYHDVVDRLLPYHVWQIHDEELVGEQGRREAIRTQRGELLCQVPECKLKPELADKNDARAFIGHIDKLKDRYTRIRRREGMFPSDLPSVITLINNSTHQVRTELDAVQSRQRAARTEFESLEAVRRARERLTSSSFPKPPTATVPSTPTRPGSSSLTSIKATSTTSITQSSPVRPAGSNQSPDRGRGRGRPRGRGSGGALTPGSSHVSTPMAMPAASASTPSGAATRKDDPAIVAKIKGGQPFKVNVPTSSLPHLIGVGIIVDPAAASADRPADPPAAVLDKSADGKLTSISMNLKKCNQSQLLVMARVLNIKLDLIKPPTGGSPAAAAPGPNTPAAKPPPAPAGPPRTDPNKRTRSSTTTST